MKESLVYLNHAAGSGRAAGVWERLRASNPQLNAARCIAGGERKQALAELRQALSGDDPPRRILAIGGDGTLHRVAHEVLELGLGEEVTLGLVPAGTGSDLARCLGLPRDPAAALERALCGQVRPIDVLRLEGPGGLRRYSINVASAGISGVVDLAIDAQERRSALVYVIETFKAAARFRSVPCRLTVDGELWFDGDAFLVALANGRTFGRGMKIAPQADLTDGLLDLVVVSPVPRWQLPWRMAQLFLGRHLDAPPVRWRRARTLRLELTPPSPPLDLDGEIFGASRVDVAVLPGALRVVV